MSEELRRQQAEYRRDLLLRVQSVACPACRQGPGVPCQSRTGKFWTNSCHVDRHDAAKREGRVAGSKLRHGPAAVRSTKGGRPAR